ncbi:RICIN domain-containing protein [Streptomyces sp. NPDC101175]|uniref:RICIN domain-containing protein n=1 Tax=Streptomyces sp. NPDC101175 TaxID=3366123 RepID=UPI003835336B
MTTFALLEPASAAVDPGSSAVATLRLRNDGDTVEEYRLSVVGDPAEWTRVAPDTLRLYPGDEGSAEVVFTPPRSAGTTAGTVRFGVLVHPRENPELSNVAEGVLTVSAFGEMRAELLPVTVRGRLSGRPRVAVDNLGNSALSTGISGKDDEDVLTFRPVPELVRVAQGRTRLARVRIRPSGVKLFGRPERYPFALTVTPAAEGDAPAGPPAFPGAAGAVPPAQLRGTFIRVALFPKWLLVLLGLLLAAAGVFAALWFVPRPSLVSNAVVRQQSAAAPAAAALPAAPASQAPPPAPSPSAAASSSPPPSPSPSPSASQSEEQQQSDGQDQGGGQQATDQAGNKVVTIRSVQNGKDLTVQDGGTGDGTPVVVSDWTDKQQGLNQFWAQLPFSDGTVALTPGNSPDSVLDKADGQPQVRIRTVQGGDTAVRQGQVPALQRWRLQPVSDGVVTIVNAQTGECLTNTGDNAQVQALACDDRFASLQQWRLGDS